MQSVRSFPPELRSVRDARAFVRSCLATVGLDPDAAELVTSELVGNVVKHAKTSVTVVLQLGAVVRLEVHDGDAVIPALADAAADAECGRGLMLVEALSLHWGAENTAGGKMIWVEVAAEPSMRSVMRMSDAADVKQDIRESMA